MNWQRIRFALLAGVVSATLAPAARGGDCAPPCTTCYKTVCCTEWVPEQYQCTRTVYKTEYKQEVYTAYRCETTTEVRTRTCTVNKMVPEFRTQVCNYNVCVPCWEERVVMKPCVTYKPETKIVRKCVDQGHWECKEVPCKPSLCERMKKCLHHDCCEECPKMKTVKCWVPCPVWIECPVTCMVRCCEYHPQTIKVCTYKTECRQKEVQVCSYRCVPETRVENYTVCVPVKVPYQATRCVAVCVPCQETVTLCRMVPHTVCKQVPVCDPCCK